MYRMNKQTLFRGRAAQVCVTFVDKNNNNEQLFTCGITGSKIRVQNEDESFTEKVASSGLVWGIPQKTYIYIYDFTAEETALMKLGADQSLFLQIDFGADFSRHEMKQFLTIIDDAF